MHWGLIMTHYKNVSLLTAFALTLAAPAISSTPHEHEGPGGPKVPAVTSKSPTRKAPNLKVPQDERTLANMLSQPNLPRDMRQLLLREVIEDPRMSQEQVFALLARFAFHDERNWAVIDQMYFNDRLITELAEQAIAPEARGQFTKQDVIKYFDLDTPKGKLNFIRDYGKGIPEVLQSEKFADAFNEDFLQTREDILDIRNSQPINLSLKQRGLRLVPREIGLLKRIEGVELENNLLVALPPEIGKMKELKGLFLSGNKLTTLPRSMAQLNNLNALYLINNELTQVPEVIFQLPNLKYLNLSGNDIKTIPPEIVKLVNLETLRIGSLRDSSPLESLPAEMGSMGKLKTLYVENAPRITTLPDSFLDANKKPKFKIVGFTGTFVPSKK